MKNITMILKNKLNQTLLLNFFLISLFLFSCKQNNSTTGLSSKIDSSKINHLIDSINYRSDDLPKTDSKEERALGIIKSIESINNLSYIKIDYVDWLTWDKDSVEIIQDAIENKIVDSTQKLSRFEIFHACSPNGFYIRNKNTKIRKFLIDKNVKIIMQNLHGYLKSNEKTCLDTFKKVYFKTYLKTVPYHIVVCDSIVTNIIEQYVP